MFKPNLLATVTVTVAVLGASAAFAQEATPAPEMTNHVSTKTRAEVIAETQDAMRRGLIARNDADVQRLAAQGSQSLKSRAEVIAETQDAMHRGLIARNDADVQRLAAQGFQSVKSRPQVRAETLAAIRFGLVRYGEAGAPQATPEQLEQIRAAGLRALERSPRMASK